jgi:tetratricopeptide (TPR) repeat protein
MAKGEYEEALRWYRRLSDYAVSAGDKFWMARAPNCLGGVHLELFDLDEALRLNLEGDEVARQLWPWPEPRGHSLVKAGLAYLQRGEHGPAEECFRRAWALLEEDVWFRWRWHIPLLRARGEFALAEGRHDEAWTLAAQSLDLATQTDSRKHVARALRLQGEV